MVHDGGVAIELNMLVIVDLEIVGGDQGRW
jgi:hypothetical protein